MSRISLIAGTIALCGLTGFSGWLHTSVVGNQRVSETLDRVGDRLTSMPESSIGPWVYVSSQPIRKSAIEMLEDPSYIMRTYLHETRGWQVTVFVVVGPHGPISVHTPDVCYPANDYEITSKAKAVSLADSADRKHAFWTMNLQSRDSDGRKLRAIYSWSDDGYWQAPRHPRFSFIGAPYLYKLQMAASVDPEAESAEDPCNEFLKDFLPVLRKHMVL